MKQHPVVKAIVLAVFIMATLNVGAQFYRTFRQNLENEGNGVIACRFGPPIDESSRFGIELALLVALIGSRQKNFTWGLLYIVGLVGTCAVYLSWWKYHFQIAENAEIEIGFGNHIAYLTEANYWDICIAVSITLLLLWEFGRVIIALLSKALFRIPAR